ncbi:hypothetical protein [Bacillus sp. REN3]|uniref:hypothetical protein n=1 Tax=Bacillus sp. REN3 TaxID=2802440 RepID=UPI001AEE1BA1|nr:hypothetical protein [Bacillus sp. REN3]
MKQRTYPETHSRKWAIGLMGVFLAFMTIGKLISGVQLPFVNEGLSLAEDSIFTSIIIFAGVNVVTFALILIKKVKDRAVSVLLVTYIGLVLVILLVGELAVPN